jgi:hypothetical protein
MKRQASSDEWTGDECSSESDSSEDKGRKQRTRTKAKLKAKQAAEPETVRKVANPAKRARKPKRKPAQAADIPSVLRVDPINLADLTLEQVPVVSDALFDNDNDNCCST